ncbi:MAG: acyl-CoA desaturase [Aestuariibacter sp.]
MDDAMVETTKLPVSVINEKTMEAPKPAKVCYHNPRVVEALTSNASMGTVKASSQKLLWVGSMFAATLIGGALTLSIENLLVFIFVTGISLCFGHSLGMHRKLIHQSYQCPKWLEYIMVHLGTVVGLAGPFGMLRTHDLRDWAQRQKECHPYLGHQTSLWQDAWWQLFCDLKLNSPPRIRIDDNIANDPIYQWMEKYWMWQQLPITLILFYLGGLPYVIWGVAARVSVSIIGHWLIGHFAHNKGHKSWYVNEACIQGHNVSFTSILTMGECWHNNHHAFPGSAKLGIEKGQWDPGWWTLLVLKKLGLVWDLVTPEQLPKRTELVRINSDSNLKHKAFIKYKSSS